MKKCKQPLSSLMLCRKVFGFCAAVRRMGRKDDRKPILDPLFPTGIRALCAAARPAQHAERSSRNSCLFGFAKKGAKSGTRWGRELSPHGANLRLLLWPLLRRGSLTQVSVCSSPLPLLW